MMPNPTDDGRPQRLLLLACSRAKRLEPESVTALDRYDGPAFRVVRRYLRRLPAFKPEIMVLSAQFGLIHASDLIPLYDARLSSRRSFELRPVVAARMRLHLETHAYCSVFVHAPSAYLDLIAEPLMYAQSRVTIAHGPPGVRLAALKAWLDKEWEEAGGDWRPRERGDSCS